ncbi:hypothetical protein R3W88_024228 [Solanum pinnatisectum]|uniref:Uncharacterized protein n=1 Tax=Solanum pinnatisectum TaxID=50273 RepID=A0AAV9M318_9SOLN|nr:hypothetical protein R3W88_024228 [Solanum pinnatisectum]
MEKCDRFHGYPSGQPANNQNPSPNNSVNRSNATRAPPRFNHTSPAPRYNRGNGNRTMANINCAGDLTGGKGTSPAQHEEMYNMNLTKEQYNHVQGLLQHFQKEHNTEESTINQTFANGTTDFAGPFNEEESSD